MTRRVATTTTTLMTATPATATAPAATTAPAAATTPPTTRIPVETPGAATRPTEPPPTVRYGAPSFARRPVSIPPSSAPEPYRRRERRKPRDKVNARRASSRSRPATTTVGSTPNNPLAPEAVGAVALGLRPGAVEGGTVALGSPGITDGGTVGVAGAEGATVAVGIGSPVNGSIRVKCSHRYSRVVTPDSWIAAATSRPT